MQKKLISNSHDFHMVLTKELKMKIMSLSLILGKSFSKTAIYIIQKSLNFFKKRYFLQEESSEFSSYQRFNWDEEMHIHLNKNMYRNLKHICSIYMTFSMAIVVRWLFNFYFTHLYNKETMQENEEEIKKIENEIKNLCFVTKKWDKSINDKQLSGKLYYQLAFNEKFCVTGFNFLQSG